MKKILPFIITALLVSCGPKAIQKSANSSLSGRSVDFNKLMNPAFAKDYIDADVITNVEFYSPEQSKYVFQKVPKDHVAFQVLAPGGTPTEGIAGTDATGHHVYIPKSQSEQLFNLEKGAPLTLTGGTYVTKLGGHETVFFKATSMTNK